MIEFKKSIKLKSKKYPNFQGNAELVQTDLGALSTKGTNALYKIVNKNSDPVFLSVDESHFAKGENYLIEYCIREYRSKVV